MIWFLVSIIIVIGVLFCGQFISEVWAEIDEYESMKARGYKLFKDDNGKYWWVD